MQRIISLTFLFTMDLSFFFTCIIGYQENTKRNENKIYFWVNRRIVSFFFFTFLDLYFPRYYPMKSYVAAESNNKKFVLSDPLCSWIKFNRMFQIEIGKRCHRIWRSNEGKKNKIDYFLYSEELMQLIFQIKRESFYRARIFLQSIFSRSFHLCVLSGFL